MATPDQIDALVSGKIDVGFIRRRDRDDRLQTRPVLTEHLVAALGPHTRWNTRVGLRSVASEPFIIIARSRSASFHDHVLSVCAAAGFAPRVVQEAFELFTVVSLVRVDQFSADGRTMTNTSSRRDARGQVVRIVAVYDKQ